MGFVDPVNLIPIGFGAKITMRTGLSAMRGAGATGLAGAIGASGSELALHQTQETRTIEESILNVGDSVILGGAIGAWSGAYKARKLGHLEEARELIEAVAA